MMSKWLPPVISALIGAAVTLIVFYFTTIYQAPKTVSGTVRDESSSQPQAGVTVRLGSHEYVTGSDGSYFFEKTVKPGFHRIYFNKKGYSESSASVQVVDDTKKDLVLLPPETPEVAVQATFEFPKDGDRVNEALVATGRVTGYLFDHHVWLVVHPSGSAGWWPQLSEIIPDSTSGRFEVPVTVGSSEDKGKQFDLVLVVANEGAHQRFTTYLEEALQTNSFPERPLPQGSRAVVKVEVARR